MKFEDLNLMQVGHSILMSGAIFSDDENVYLCMFPNQHGELRSDVALSFADTDSDAKVHTLNMDVDQWTQFVRQTDLMETEILAKDTDGKIIKAIVRKCQRQIDGQVMWRVFKRDGYKCRYCGNSGIPLTVDHLILWEEGGPSIDKNLITACRKCNKTRGNTSYVDWLNHPVYRKVSRNLTEAEKAANVAVASTLDSIQRVHHVRSR